MSDIDLTEVVDLAFDETLTERSLVALDDSADSEHIWTLLRAALTAALPHIERQVREQVAQEIEAEAAKQKRWANEFAAARGGVRSHADDGNRLGLDRAARIARGEQSGLIARPRAEQRARLARLVEEDVS